MTLVNYTNSYAEISVRAVCFRLIGQNSNAFPASALCRRSWWGEWKVPEGPCLHYPWLPGAAHVRRVYLELPGTFFHPLRVHTQSTFESRRLSRGQNTEKVCQAQQAASCAEIPAASTYSKVQTFSCFWLKLHWHLHWGPVPSA